MKNMIPAPSTDSCAPASPSRRLFLTRTAQAAGAASLLSFLPRSWAAPDLASDAPETPNLRIGIIALTDCSPLVIAHEKGLFKKYGINATIAKGANWAAIRDSLSNGDLQATHTLLGMPLASTMGLFGSPKKPMVVPWLLNRNGQAISLKAEWKGKVGADPAALRPFVDQARKLGVPLGFAMTFPPGTHAMWLRYYLAHGGIHPDKDVSLITIPPPQMITNMKVGKMDGFCVGEPWNARAIADGIGFTAISTQEIWQDHPEKVCAFTADFAEKNPRTVKAVLKALHEASVWLDDMANRPELCNIVSRPNYINCPRDIILDRLLGQLDYGDGRSITDPFPMHFSQRNCNFPQPKFAKWWLSQFRRWGMVSGTPDYASVASQVMRGDLYLEAMREIGVTDRMQDDSPFSLFDNKPFDPSEPETYATSFPINSLRD